MFRIQDITLGQYAPRESIVHKLDPRTKIISSLIFMVLLMFVHRIELFLVFIAAIMLFFYLSKLSWALSVRNLRPFLWLFILTLLFHSIFTEGKILLRIEFIGLTITEEGIVRGLFYTIRIALLAVLASLLTLTTSPMSLADAFQLFLSPFKRIGVPAHEIAMMLSISLRFIPILIQEAERIRKAQFSRGCQISGSLINKLRSIVPLIVPLFLSTFRRANDLALAMDSRCYGRIKERTSYYVLRFRRADAVAFLVVFAFGFPVVMMQFFYV
ncbi:energy-coupling factor transporter transmembrane protein EcfT [bacterium]|nr:energy-coupling factor transporter transmembrane protein EcfT [bacterium]RQV96010.1 MAG: energy-coupling factor transporter transmembrane protein EcfT [bacterium]